MILHIDIETFSSVDIRTAGAYKYADSLDFEILMVAYAYDDNPVQIVDLAQGEKIPQDLLADLTAPDVKKYAHNANFERTCFKAYGIDIPVEQIHCTAVLSSYCGLPIALAGVSGALNLGDKAKDKAGKALIRYFCIPCKPTKTNGGRYRNFPKHDLEKWNQFLDYCIQDVVAEREVHKRLERYEIPDFERRNYIVDQVINDRGVGIDIGFANTMVDLYTRHTEMLKNKIKEITKLENPNSPAQLKKWMSAQLGKEIKSIAKDKIKALLKKQDAGPVREVLELRADMAKTSSKKYKAMQDCILGDDRGRGFVRFYGAKTGRWAGRLVQIQNLPRNKFECIDELRGLYKSGDRDLIYLVGDVSNTISQLVRTAFVPQKDNAFVISDFSAIEARVIAWVSGEQWRLEIFKTHGKIYEASASMMFKVPIEEVTKGSDLRAKGKIAELALGYQGAVGALKQMDTKKSLEESEMKGIVKMWREANPNIVALWESLNLAAVTAIKRKRKVTLKNKLVSFEYDGTLLKMWLPSGRHLSYWGAELFEKITLHNGREWRREAVRFKGIDQKTRQWGWIDTYGGKLTENLIQAIARDLLADCMDRLERIGYKIVMHVHDEVIIEIPEVEAADCLSTVEDLMSRPPLWAEGLPLGGDGFISKYYQKD